MTLDWHEPKRLANIAKHGIDFATLEPFFQSERITNVDTRQDYGEVRLTAFGTLYGRVLFVVYTMRGAGDADDDPSDGVIHIISARRASAQEENIYYDEIGLSPDR